MEIKKIITDKQRSDIIDYVKKSNTIDLKPFLLVTNGSTTTFTTKDNLLPEISENIPSCKNLKETLFEKLNEYCVDSLFHIHAVTNCWVTIQTKGSELHDHTHPLTTISGVIFLNVDKNSSKLVFRNPVNLMEFTMQKSLDNSIYTITPENGSLLIFPSWLKHGSFGEINYTEERIILSFNVV
jgi:uncharacterized protein (TIGR02466 family)